MDQCPALGRRAAFDTTIAGAVGGAIEVAQVAELAAEQGVVFKAMQGSEG